MKRIALALAFLLFASIAHAQAATVIYDYALTQGPTTVTVGQVQAWKAELLVNGTPFVLVGVSCVQSGVAPNLNATCSAPLPNITTALTASGGQTFTARLSDAVLGVGGQSLPLVKVLPNAPSLRSIQ